MAQSHKDWELTHSRIFASQDNFRTVRPDRAKGLFVYGSDKEIDEK